MRARGTLAVLIAVAAALPDPAPAQSWPARPLTMVVTFAAGGGDDVLARIIGPRLSQALGQPVVIENISGAGGMTGAARVAKAPRDGYQFVLGGTGPFAANQTLYRHPLYRAETDFAPVALLAEQPLLLLARKDFPANDLPAFIAYTKANQAHMQYGSPGVGSTSHLACVLLNAAIGLDVTNVPYRGGAPAYQDLIAGRIDYMCPYSSTATPQVRAGVLKAIAVLSKHRLPALPNVGSADEQGLPGFDAYQWFGLFLPRGTPAEIVSKLHDAAVAALDSPEVRERLDQIGASVVAPERRSSAYLQGFVARETSKWGAAIRAANIELE